MRQRILWMVAIVLGLVAVGGVSQVWGETTTVELPGKISLPDGWVVEKGEGDSSFGVIRRENWASLISFDIGRMAGAQVTKADPARQLWYREQKVGGHTVKMEMVPQEGGSVSLKVTFYDGGASTIAPANFHVRDLKKMEDVAEVMAVILSYEYGGGIPAR